MQYSGYGFVLQLVKKLPMVWMYPAHRRRSFFSGILSVHRETLASQNESTFVLGGAMISSVVGEVGMDSKIIEVPDLQRS